MQKRMTFLVTLLFLSLAWSIHAATIVPMLLNYQGKLTDASGQSLTQTVSVVFMIYDAENGTSKWSETHPQVPVQNGLFNVLLGNITPLTEDVFDGEAWLGVAVDGQELLPRKQIVSVAYAYKAKQASSVTDGAITEANLQNNAVTTSKIADNAVTSSKIATGAVENIDLADNAVTATKILPNLVSSINSVTNDGGNINLVAGSNITITPNDGSDTITISATGGGGIGDITKVTAGTGLTGGGDSGDVTLSAILGTSISVSEIDPNAVTSSKIQDGAVSSADLANNSVTSSKIADGSVSSSDLASSSVTNSKIASNAVTSSKIASGAVGSSDLANQVKFGQTGSGRVAVNNSSGTDVGSLSSIANGGGFFLRTNSGSQRGTLQVDTAGGGGLFLDGSSGNDLATIGGLSGSSNNGGLWLKSNGSDRVFLYVSSSNAGYLSLKNGSGGSSIWLNGANGSVSATIKNFVMDHPLNPNLTIAYASIEGPEAAAYTRGTARLVNGEAVVRLPEHFSLVVNDEGLTVQVTSLSADSEGLAVVGKSGIQIVVKELRGGRGNYDFDYIVQGVRKGFEGYQVIRDKIGGLAEPQAAASLAAPLAAPEAP